MTGTTMLRSSERLLKKSNAKKANYDLIKNNKTKRLQNKLELLRTAGIIFKKNNEKIKRLQHTLELLKNGSIINNNSNKKTKYLQDKLELIRNSQ